MFSPNMKFILDTYKLLDDFFNSAWLHENMRRIDKCKWEYGWVRLISSHTCFCTNRLKLNLVINTSGARDD